MKDSVINCITSLTFTNEELKSFRSNQENLDTAFQMKPSAAYLILLKLVIYQTFVNYMNGFGFYDEEIRFNHFVDHIIVVLPFLAGYNLIRSLEALYLGYLYSILFWLRSLAGLIFALVDLWFWITLMQYRDNRNNVTIYGFSGLLIFIWAVTGTFIIVKYRPGKVTKVKLTFLKLASIIGIRGFKGLLTIACSVTWRYLFYEPTYSVTDYEDVKEIKRNIYTNFVLFIIFNYIYTLLTALTYFASLKFVSARLLIFGHFSSKYSKGNVVVAIGDTIDSVLGLVFA